MITSAAGTVKPRLLIILNRFVIGGQAVDTLPLAHFLQKHFDVLILYGEKEQDEIEPFFLLELYPGVKIKKITRLKRSINPFTDVFGFIKILNTIIKYKPDIIHTHGAKSGLLGRLAAFISGVPVIIHTFHGHLFHSYYNRSISRLIALIERSLGRITTGFIALSSSQFNELVNGFKIAPASKMKIIPLGVGYANGGVNEVLRAGFRDRYGIKHNEVAIGIVGRIVPVKNHLFFLAVIQKILNSNSDNKPVFLIIGDGELRNNLEDYLTQNNIGFSNNVATEVCRVVFTSWITNIEEVMSGLDIVTLTSLNEGTPLSIIEAQSFGKPVVATDVGGVKDTMIDEVTGFYVDKEDVPGFTARLELLMNDADKRRTMGLLGRQFVQERFSKQKEVEATKDFYFSLLKRKGFYRERV